MNTYPVKLTSGEKLVLKQRLVNLFEDLKAHGVFARMNWQCCQTCGWAAVPDEVVGPVVFFHEQDAERLLEDGGTMLAHGFKAPRETTHAEDVKAGQMVLEMARKWGLGVEWSGSPDQRVWVGLSHGVATVAEIEDAEKSGKYRELFEENERWDDDEDEEDEA